MPEVRRRLRELKSVDEGALDVVYGALADEDPGVRREAIKLIGRSPASPGLLLTLERALTDERELGRRSAAMEALAGMGKPALALLSRLASDPRVGVRRLAVDALGLSRLPESVDVLEKTARDPQAAVRSAALEAVARTGAVRAPTILMRAVEDRAEQPAVVLAALLGLLHLEKVPSVHTLKRLAVDALTAPPALRLLGRAGEVAFLADAVTAQTGSRQRAAVLGLADALELIAARAASSTSGPQPPSPGAPGLGARTSTQAYAASVQAGAGLERPAMRSALRSLVESSDAQVACAALIVAAHAGDVEVLLAAAARDDRAALSSAAHRALPILATALAAHTHNGAPRDLAAELRVLIADDAPGAELLHELAEAAARISRASGLPSAAGQVGAVGAGGPRLDDRSFARLSRLLESAAGLAITDDARVRLEARLLPRVEETGAGGFAQYLDKIAPMGASAASLSSEANAELLRALDLVTVHETYFFREKAQLEAFRDEVILKLANAAASGAPGPRGAVRVWSAGCSTGEEAYTLAMLLEEAGVRDYDVLGTDVSRDVIETARAGKYMPRSFRGEIDAPVRKRWFIYELGGVQVHPDLKKSVRFDALNLLDENAVNELPAFDAIFCRNVLIYMSAQARARAIDLFWRKLKPGGVLLLGHSESLLHVDTPFKLKALKRGLGYEKPA